MAKKKNIAKSDLSSINLKIGLSFLIIFVLLITITVSLTYVLFNNIIKSSENRLSQNITSVLSISISRISFSGKYHAQIFSDQLLKKEDSIKYIVILDNNGEVVSNSSKDVFRHFINEKHMERLKEHKGNNEISFVTCCGGQKIKEIAMPYFGSFDEGQIGVIITGISTLETFKEISNTRITLILLAIFIILLGAFSIIFATRILSMPIRRLASMFQGILDNAPFLIHIRDLNGNVIASNAKDESVGEIFSQKVTVNPDKGLNIVHLPQHGQSFLTLNFGLSDASGKLYGACDMANDITEQEKIQRALTKSESDFQAIYELSPVGIANIDAEGRFLRANPSLQKILGYSEEELKKLTFLNITLPEELEENSTDLKVLVSGEENFREFYKRHVRKDKSIVWLHLLVTAQRDENGKFLQTISLVENVTDKMNAESAREQILVQEKEARIEAQKAVKIRDEFLSIASHELKTPLTTLVLQTQFLYKLFREKRLLEVEESKLRDLFLGSIQQLDRFSKLINDLLNVSKIQSGQLLAVKEDVNLHHLVEGVLRRFKMQIEDTQTDVKLMGDSSVIGHWGRLQVEQVVINLLSNALKFSSGKSISLSVSQKEGWAHLSVKDSGIGISQDNLGRIFERFERAVPVENYGGLGLGLYIVKQFVLAHEGRVHVNSTEGLGSEFVVELPLK